MSQVETSPLRHSRLLKHVRLGCLVHRQKLRVGLSRLLSPPLARKRARPTSVLTGVRPRANEREGHACTAGEQDTSFLELAEDGSAPGWEGHTSMPTRIDPRTGEHTPAIHQALCSPSRLSLCQRTASPLLFSPVGGVCERG